MRSRQGIERVEGKAVGSSCKSLGEKIMRPDGTEWRQRNRQEGQPLVSVDHLLQAGRGSEQSHQPDLLLG